MTSKMARPATTLLAGVALTVSLVGGATAQSPDYAKTEHTFRIVPSISYLKVGTTESTLDLYVHRTSTEPEPTLIWIHGGGWNGGAKENEVFAFQSYMAMGLNVVSVDYRLSAVATAPAALEDTKCALRWVVSHAKEYGIDTQKLVMSGGSSGGHLAMATAFIPAAAGFDVLCPGPDIQVAAVVNWYGISDVNELLEGPNQRPFAVTWLGNAPDKQELAKRLSPLTYVRAGLPPVLTIHGDADPTVPYAQAVRLQKALTAANVQNELLTIPQGRHAFQCCTLEQRQNVYQTLRAFLVKNGVLRAAGASQP
jgi:acetyl esterase/lipase